MTIFFDTKTLILLGGPTASGKSAVAVELAQRMSGEVLNADSTQVYKDLPTLTAVPSEAERGGVPHHLYQILNWEETSSVADWLNRVDVCVSENWDSNTFITVGGTGLYLSSLMYGLSPIPEISEEVRSKVRKQGQALLISSGPFALYEQVVRRDPMVAGRIHPNHSQRLLRAWEVFEQTNRSIVLWQKEPRLKNSYPKSQLFVVEVPQDVLEENIARRCRKMVENGVLDEVKAFMEVTKGAWSPLHRSLGFFEFKQVVEGKQPLEEALEHIVVETRQYAKRQRTWFRTQYEGKDVCSVPYAPPAEQADFILNRLMSAGSEF